MKGWPNSSDSQQTLYDAVLQQHRWCLMFFSSKSCAAVDALCENLHSACGFTFSHRTSSCFRDFLHLHIRSRELCMFGTSLCSGKTSLLWGVGVFMSWRPYGTWNCRYRSIVLSCIKDTLIWKMHWLSKMCKVGGVGGRVVAVSIPGLQKRLATWQVLQAIRGHMCYWYAATDCKPWKSLWHGCKLLRGIGL